LCAWIYHRPAFRVSRILLGNSLKEIPDGADHEPGKEPVQHVDALQFSQLKTDLDF
jgi:hypothetical protein